MKMKMIGFTAFVAVLLLVSGCGSTSPSLGGSSRTAKSAGGDKLDRAIRETSDYLNRRIPNGTKVVFLNIKSDWPDLSGYILDSLTENAVNDEVFAVVDRQQLDAIRSELNFQWSGEVSDASAQEIGQMLGAQTIVSGSVTTIGSIYRIQARAIAVQTAAVQGQFSQNVDGKGPTIAALTERKAPAGSSAEATASTSARTTAGTQAAQAPAAATYKIGDTGPAGGLIFYDKGNNSGGWRYLEAAPAEIEFQAPWSVRLGSVLNMVKDTKSDIGSGKQNTQLIVEKLKQSGGEWDSAAIKVVELKFNGFSDWFLPSSGELDQMYGNLKRRNLGDFTDGWYWSSTENRQGPDLGWGVILQNFSNSQIAVAEIGIMSDGRSRNHYVRPIRQVAGPAGTARSSAEPPVGTSGTTSRVSDKRKITLYEILGFILGAALIGYIGYVVITNPDAAPAH